MTARMLTGLKGMMLAAGLAMAAASAGAVAPASTTAAPTAPAPAAPGAATSPELAMDGAPAMIAAPEVGHPISGRIGIQPQVTANGRFAHWMHDSILLPLIIGICLFVLALLAWVVFRYRRAAHPVPSLREVVGAGEPLNPEVIEQVEKAWGMTVRDGYGQTETTAQIGNPPGARLKPGSMGRPLPGYTVALVDPLTSEVGTEGEICLDLSARPTALMVGYLDDQSLTDEVMRGGYYHTGDVAAIDDEGYISYIGRTDDVFKASDYKISPFELESVLIEHPAVAEAAIVPAPDAVRLAVPKAYLVLVEGSSPDAATAESIFAFARERLAPWQRVRRLEFAELPKTISGKIRRVELRGRENDLARNDVRPDGEFRDDDFEH